VIKVTEEMLDEYDFSNARPNPYARNLKKPVTIRLEASTIDYFKNLATKSAIPYQTLMNLYLADCAKNELQPSLAWS